MSNLLPKSVATTSQNPFLPDFGQAPHIIVGRDDMTSDLLSGLATGPTDRRFCTIVLGPRGSGKTVFQSEIEDIVQENGWLVLSVDASTTGLHERIKQVIVNARDNYEGAQDAHPDALHGTRLSGVQIAGLGVNWANFNPRPEWNTRHLLEALAKHAQSQNSAVLLSLDEMQAGNHRELKRLASDLQHIIKRDNLPIAFLGAGLPEMKHMLLADKKITFFHRCEKRDMKPLHYTDSIQGLRDTIRDSNGNINHDALEIAAASVGPLPYRLQLLGYNMWKLGGAPKYVIDIHTTNIAIEATNAEMADQVYQKCWQDLSDDEQSYLNVIASSDRGVSRSDITKSFPKSSSKSSRSLLEIEARLTDMEYIQATNGDHPTHLSCTSLLPRNFLREIISRDGEYALATKSDIRIVSTKKLCNKYMPIAKTRCALPDKHKWGCRASPYHSS